MRFVFLSIILILVLTACDNKKTPDLPPAPANAGALSNTIKGKKFKTAGLALVSNLAADKNDPYEWFDEIKDSTPYFRNYEKQKMKFEITFINDTSAEITYEAGENKASWGIDNQPKSDETAGLFLRLSMERQEKLVPGQVGTSMITFSYKVLGVDDKQLFLQTPNMYSGKKIAALMKTE